MLTNAGEHKKNSGQLVNGPKVFEHGETGSIRPQHVSILKCLVTAHIGDHESFSMVDSEKYVF